MSIKKFILFIFLALIILWLVKYPASRALHLSAWLTYFDFEDSLSSFKDNVVAFDEINPFIYCLDKDGAIIKAEGFSDSDLKKIKVEAAQRKIKVIPTIVNDVITNRDDFKDILKDPRIIHSLLTDDLSLKKHIADILSVVNNDGLDGIEIDYENLDPEISKQFIKFIQLLAQQLQRTDKQLNLVLETKAIVGKAPLFSKADLAEISACVDAIKIMCYNLHGAFSEPGPVATIEWIKEISRDLINKLPREKITLAIAMHGFDWSGKGVSQLTYKKAMQLAWKHNSGISRDRQGNPYFTYSDEGMKHFVWFEDTESITKKIGAITRFGIYKIALWRLGGEPQNLYSRPPVTCVLR